MNCQKFLDVVSELARGQMMDADLWRDAVLHSESCTKCAVRLQREHILTQALHTLSTELQSKQAPDRLELQLRKTFRAQHSLPSTEAVTHSYRRYWLVAAAAALLLVGSIVALRMRDTQPRPIEKQLAAQDPNATPKQTTEPVQVAVEPAESKSHNNAVPKPGRRHVVARTKDRKAAEVVANHATEIATEFIPLPYSGGVSLQDGGQIVRVELPRSALAKFGLPVNVERLNEKVKADVWLGVDGLAHAIRFVQ